MNKKGLTLCLLCGMIYFLTSRQFSKAAMTEDPIILNASLRKQETDLPFQKALIQFSRCKEKYSVPGLDLFGGHAAAH